MNKIPFVLVLFFGLVSSVLGADPIYWIYRYVPSKKSSESWTKRRVSSAWETPSVSFRSVIADKYILSNGEETYNKPVIQSDLYIGFENGFFIDLWNSAPFEGYGQNLGTEQDYGIGWEGPLSKFGFGKKTIVSVGVTYCNEPKMTEFGMEDMVYSYVKLSQTTAGFNFYGMYESNIPMPKSSYHGGSLLSVGVSRKDSLLDKLDIDVSFAPVYDSGNFGLNSGLFLKGGVGFNWLLEKNLTMILPQVNYYVPLTMHDSRSSAKTVAGGLSYQF